MIKLFLFFFVVLPLLVFVLGIITVVHRLKRRFDAIQRQYTEGMNAQQRTGARHRSNGSRARSGTVYDTRSAERQRKIIPKDEGEYVSYEEER